MLNLDNRFQKSAGPPSTLGFQEANVIFTPDVVGRVQIRYMKKYFVGIINNIPIPLLKTYFWMEYISDILKQRDFVFLQNSLYATE